MRSPHICLAGALTLLVTSPVFIWNAQHRFASLELHADDRLRTQDALFTPHLFVVLVVYSILAFSPFLLPSLLRFVFHKAPEGPAKGTILVGRLTAIISTVFFVPLSAWGAFGVQVSPHWIVLSFLPLMLVAPLYVRSPVAIWLHISWGGMIMALALVYYLLAPLPTDLLGMDDNEATFTYGQEQLAAAVLEAGAAQGTSLIVVRGYPDASRLAFALGTDANITDLGGRIDRLTGRDPVAEFGKNAIVVGSNRLYQHLFESLEPLEAVVTTRFGRPLESYRLSLGRGITGD